MAHPIELFLTSLDRLVFRFWMIALSTCLTGTQVPATAQANCTSYNNCSALQEVSSTKLSGNISYSFDEAALNAAFHNDQIKIQDFKNRMAAAANDWAQKTGRSITAASSGQAGNVTITVSGSQEAHNRDGFPSIDPNNSARRIITLSDEYSLWSVAGRDRMASHEWGHVLGLEDVEPDECPGVETVMRQNGPGATRAEIQLRQGYTCESISSTTVGDPNGCSAESKLPRRRARTPATRPRPGVSNGPGLMEAEVVGAAAEAAGTGAATGPWKSRAASASGST